MNILSLRTVPTSRSGSQNLPYRTNGTSRKPSATLGKSFEQSKNLEQRRNYALNHTKETEYYLDMKANWLQRRTLNPHEVDDPPQVVRNLKKSPSIVAYEPDYEAASRHIELNRPKRWNALSIHMIETIRRLFSKWESAQCVYSVTIKAHGSAFCVGADFLSVYEANDLQFARRFFKELYLMAYEAATFGKIYFPLADGLMMGAGAALFCHSPLRVATPKAMLASSEPAMGWFVDCGMTKFYSRLPNHLGKYIALTGKSLKFPELMKYGIVTHAMRKESFHEFDNQLGMWHTNNLLRKYEALFGMQELGFENYDESTCFRDDELEAIKRTFDKETLEEVFEALEKEEGYGYLCKAALEKMKTMSPLGLKITWRLLKEAETKSMPAILNMEHRVAQRLMRSFDNSDFFEGAKTFLVKKGKVKPRWKHQSIYDIPESYIDALFKPLTAAEELRLPESNAYEASQDGGLALTRLFKKDISHSNDQSLYDETYDYYYQKGITDEAKELEKKRLAREEIELKRELENDPTYESMDLLEQHEEYRARKADKEAARFRERAKTRMMEYRRSLEDEFIRQVDPDYFKVYREENYIAHLKKEREVEKKKRESSAAQEKGLGEFIWNPEDKVDEYDDVWGIKEYDVEGDGWEDYGKDYVPV